MPREPGRYAADMPTESQITLPDPLPHLRWSAASAAFQVEGARTAGGRGRSIWDDWVETPGKVKDGATTEPGPDSYRRFPEDVSLAADLGLDRYRFGISWVRVLPDGTPAGVSQDGLDYYDRVVDSLLDAGVTPFPTLYHWDLPVGFEAAGGWLNRDTAERFRDYVEVVAQRLGDRVKHWYTINEPAMTTLQGYGLGDLAPGRQELFGALPTAHHQLLAHALAAPVLRSNGADQVGLANNHTHVLPLTDSPEDLMAAGVYNTIHNRLFAEPLLLGRYPELEELGLPAMPVHPGDLELIKDSSDFYAVNFYNPTTVTAAPPGDPLPFDLVPTPGAPTTGFGQEWPIVPQSLTALLTDLERNYPDLPPVIISENGASFPEPDTLADGEVVNDVDRIEYLKGHIEAVAVAQAAGVDIQEYTVWALIDNFEWADGYTQRFGLTHVDMETGERTPKASFEWLRRTIAAARS